MSEIKRSEIYYFTIGQFEFRFTRTKESVQIKNCDIVNSMRDPVIPISTLKEAIKKVEEYKIK